MLSNYATDYESARESFRAAAAAAGLETAAYPISAQGPGGEVLAIDVAIQPGGRDDGALVLSSGLHGVEGLFGSAVQCAALRYFQQQPEPSRVRIVYLHALNPFGFAWRRRMNEENVDPNRNFLLAGELYRGAPPGYAELDSLLNPRSAPRCCDLFLARAALARFRHGSETIKQAIAGGQYEYPQGLFYGGAQLSASGEILGQVLPDAVGPARRIVHLDFHTGLGSWATYKLLSDSRLSESARRLLAPAIDMDTIEENDPAGLAYQVRGGIGPWCAARLPNTEYTYFCAEFGTYGPLSVVAGLRKENQAWHHTDPHDPRRDRAAAALQELFCPAQARWRNRCLQQGVDLVAACNVARQDAPA